LVAGNGRKVWNGHKARNGCEACNVGNVWELGYQKNVGRRCACARAVGPARAFVNKRMKSLVEEGHECRW
jgi:hypothetical protein